MKNLKVRLKIAFFSCCALVILTGCLRAGTPALPDSTEIGGPEKISETRGPDLWGFYRCWIDLENMTVEAVPARLAEFTANVMNFLNSKPSTMGFLISDVTSGPNYVDITLDVSVTHPFPGLPQFDGYDVRGIFMGDGSASLSYGGGSLVYPVLGTDQSMTADSEKGWPDGYTRWFNLTEFVTGGMSIVSEQQWEYDQSAQVWDENGDIGSMYTGCINAWLQTPPLDLPDESMGDFDIITSGAGHYNAVYLSNLFVGCHLQLLNAVL